MITPINTYYSKTYTSKKKNVNFQGAIGDKILKETAGKKLTINTLKLAVFGLFGISAAKLDDVFESLCNKINSQSKEINDLKKQNADSKKEIESLEASRDRYYEYGKSDLEEVLQEMKEIADENTKLKIENKNLKQNIRILNFIPIKEMQPVTPEEVISTIDIMKKTKPAAEKSLYNYVMTGIGQEEFLKFISNNNIIVKARHDNMQNEPKTAQILEENDFGKNSIILACEMLSNILKEEKDGEKILSPEIHKDITIRAEAILEIFRDDNTDSEELINKTLENVKNFYDMLENNKTILEKNGWEYKYRGTSKRTNKPYLSYTHPMEGSLMIDLKDLAYGNFDKAFLITPYGSSKLLNLKIK